VWPAKICPVPFLHDLGGDARADLEATGRRVRYRPGDVLFHEGDRPEFAIVIASGTVKVSARPQHDGLDRFGGSTTSVAPPTVASASSCASRRRNWPA